MEKWKRLDGKIVCSPPFEVRGTMFTITDTKAIYALGSFGLGCTPSYVRRDGRLVCYLNKRLSLSETPDGPFESVFEAQWSEFFGAEEVGE